RSSLMRARVCSYSKSYQFTTNYLGDTPLAPPRACNVRRIDRTHSCMASRLVDKHPAVSSPSCDSSPMTGSVAVLGAGPGGLATARWPVAGFRADDLRTGS